MSLTLLTWASNTFPQWKKKYKKTPHTNGDGVDGVGIAVVVAVVVVLPAVTTGNHKDASEPSSASDHSMLQRRLQVGGAELYLMLYQSLLRSL